jgi:tetratricopeptide (TPR) repeat protein
LLAYIPAMQAGMIWDDEYHLTENLHVYSIAGLKRVWLVLGSSRQYYPMIDTSFWLEHRLYGTDPTGYHVSNVLLHALNALLFWRLLVLLALPGAWLAGAMFALHPVAVESVAWISERKNLLSTFFYLSAMHAYFRYEPPEGAQEDSLAFRRYLLAFFLFLCALFSKTVTFSLPAAIALIFWWKRGSLDRRSLFPLLPFVAAGALLGSVTVYLEKHLVGASGPEWDFGVVDRVLIAGRAAWFYFGQLVWPSSLTFSYERWEIDSGVAWQYAYPLAGLAALAAAWAARHRIGRGPLTAMLFFGGTLVPALGFFDVFPFRYSFVADHFQYLAMLGPIALLAAAATKLLTKIPLVAARHALIAALLLTCGALAFSHARVFEGPFTLWTDVIEKNPRSILAHNNLAAWYAERGEFAKAVELNRAELRIDPGDSIANFNLAVNLGQLGDREGAIRHFRIQLDRDPEHLLTHERLAQVLDVEGRDREAIGHYEEARRLGSSDPMIESRLRALRRRSGLR